MAMRHYWRAEVTVFRSLATDKSGYLLWLFLRGLPGVLLCSLFLLLLSIRPAWSQSLDTLSPNDVRSGQLLFRQSATDPYQPGLALAGKTEFAVTGMVATVSVEQTFRNISDGWVEGVYAFPLPDQAAVRHMEMIIGERRIVGKIKEKLEAKAIYDKAKSAGKKASLVEQNRPNLFLNRVANIGPGEEVTVRLEYIQSVQYIAGEFSLRFPMTITPRYRPRSASVSQREPVLEKTAEDLLVDALVGWVIPEVPVVAAGHNQMQIQVSLNMGMSLAEVSAPYHDIVLSRQKQHYQVSLAQGKAVMNRDFVLQWRPVTASAPTAAVFEEVIDGASYGLVMMLPPASALTSPDDVLPREVIFVIDTSGSMGGESIDQAKESLLLALDQLGEDDTFNVVEFNSIHRAFYPTAVPADPRHVGEAKRAIRALSAGGGTEMLPALMLALGNSNTREEHSQTVRQIVFITDGAVGNESELFAAIAGSLGSTRLFTVGIGSAPNSWFMRKAAQFGRGSHIHIGDTGEVAQKMQDLLGRISSPVATDINIQWPVDVEAYPTEVPDLFLGEPVVVAYKRAEKDIAGAQEIEIRGLSASGPWRQKVVGAASSIPDSAGVASLWARQKLASLLDQKAMGKSEQWVREQVLSVALAHKLMSPYTSFVAVEQKISRPDRDPLDKAMLSSQLPKGALAAPIASIAYPATATTGPAKLFLGSLLLFLALIFHMLRRPETGVTTEADHD